MRAIDYLESLSLTLAARWSRDYVVLDDRPSAPGASPNDQPGAKALGAEKTLPAQPVEKKGEEAKKDEGEEKKDEENKEEDKVFRLFQCPTLESHRIDLRGWLDQGYTWNPDRPANRFNGPVGYNDRANEYMLNQLYFIAERTTKTDEYCWDWGGRVDLLYGEDWRYPQAVGLETFWNRNQRFYGLAMPQLYGDIAYDKLTFRGGHFLASCGYESVMAAENFFYSHSHTFLYAQPTTLTGGMVKYQLNERLSVNGGIDNGWNGWDTINNKAGCFMGINWTR